MPIKKLNSNEYARAIAFKVIEQFGIPDIKAGVSEKTFETDLCYQERNHEFAIIVNANPKFTKSTGTFSLTDLIVSLRKEVEDFLSCPEVRVELEIDDSKIVLIKNEMIFSLACDYVQCWTRNFYHSFFVAMKESVVSLTKKVAEPNINRSRERRGKVKIDLFPDGELGDIFRKYRKVPFYLLKYVDHKNIQLEKERGKSFKDRKALLGPKTKEKLPELFTDLKKKYSSAHSEYKKQLKDYEKKNRFDRDQFELHWMHHARSVFPELIFANDFLNRRPSELAKAQLAWDTGYRESYIEKLLRPDPEI